MPPTLGNSVLVPSQLASITSVKTLGPLSVALFALLTLIEGTAHDGREFAIGALLFFVPMAAAALCAHRAAEARWSSMLTICGAGFGLQMLLGLLMATLTGLSFDVLLIVLLIAVFTTVIVAVCGTPLVIAASVLGPRKDLEAGDTMLAASGTLLVVAQVLKIAALPEHVFSYVPGLALGMIAVVVHITRALTRRDWSDRATRGLLDGWRVRTRVSEHELTMLPPLFGAQRHVSGVLERVEMGGSLYRSGLIGEPVATLQVRGVSP